MKRQREIHLLFRGPLTEPSTPAGQVPNKSNYGRDRARIFREYYLLPGNRDAHYGQHKLVTTRTLIKRANVERQDSSGMLIV